MRRIMKGNKLYEILLTRAVLIYKALGANTFQKNDT